MQHTHMQQRWPAGHFRRTHAMQGLKKAASAPLLAQPSGSAPKHQQPPPVLCAPSHLFPPTSAGSPPLVAASFERAQGLRSLITQAPALAFVFHSARALKSTEARALRQACPLRIRHPISERPFQCLSAALRAPGHARMHAQLVTRANTCNAAPARRLACARLGVQALEAQLQYLLKRERLHTASADCPLASTDALGTDAVQLLPREL